MEIPGWEVIVSLVFYMLCFYFTLSFIESLHEKDQRVVKQSKRMAVVCLIIAVLLPVVYWAILN